jgi:hypothetical protein
MGKPNTAVAVWTAKWSDSLILRGSGREAVAGLFMGGFMGGEAVE